MGKESREGTLPERLYQVLVEDFPDHVDGQRPVHARGIGVVGHFVPSTVARNFSVAEQFAGGAVPVTVRFSNGTGSPKAEDGAPDVRGLALKFHLPSGREADLIMITLPVFFADTPDTFLGFGRAGRPTPVEPESWWAKLKDTLQLREHPPAPDPEQPTSGAAGVLEYANRHAGARPGTVAATMLMTPTSYGRAKYHALHAFKLTDPAGVVRYARFGWEPVAGVHPPDAGTRLPDDHLQGELRERLGRGPVRFVLRMVIAGQGDDIDNPAQVWDTTRTRVVMGELFLTGLVEDQEAGCERLSFNPTRVVPGFECSGDPVLHARGAAYEYSCRRRGGSGCPVGGDWQ
jgi:catalase